MRPGRTYIFNCITSFFLVILLLSIPDPFPWIWKEFAKLITFFHLLAFVTEIIQNYLFTCKVDPANKAVLITGCDSGFGNALAKRLDKAGYTVFAACLDSTGRGATDLKASCSHRMNVVPLDVTDQDSVDRCVAMVKQRLGLSELWALVNNAGILKGFLIELSSMKDFEDCMAVNGIGVVRVTKAFLPLIRQARGRVVNVCSQAGRHSAPLLGPYNLSKFAAVTFSESLCMEMEDFGVEVITVEPEFFKTPMCSKQHLDSILDSSLSKADPEIISDYGTEYIDKMKNMFYNIISGGSENIDKVISSMESAVTLRHPRRMYQPCRSLYSYCMLHFGWSVKWDWKRATLLLYMKYKGYRRTKNDKGLQKTILQKINYYPVQKIE